MDPQEHVNSIPLRQLMYGCEYCRDGELYRKSPDQDLDSLHLDTCKLPTQEKSQHVRDKPKSTMVSLFINRPIQPQRDLTIENGGHYWQILWNHLSLDKQKQINIQYPDTIFPPHWPQAIPSGYHNNQKISNQLESDYTLAARDIYDVLDTLDQQEEVDQEIDDEDNSRPPETSSQANPSKPMETLSSVDSSTNSLIDPPRQATWQRRREDDRIS
jgi:hypothetical protein